jgi:hypothetical protein
MRLTVTMLAAGNSRDRAVNQETVLRNEWGIRTFGYTSLVVDPPDGRIPPMTPEASGSRGSIPT